MRKSLLYFLASLLSLGAQEPSTMVWQGFSRTWKNFPHRISWLGSSFYGMQQVGDFLEGTVSGRMKIGAFPEDKCTSFTYGTAVASDKLAFQTGEATLSLTAPLGDWGHASETINLQMGALAGWDHTVVLRGLNIVSSNEPGWHTRGFYVGVDKVKLAANGELSFRCRADMRSENSPDPFSRQKGSFAYKVTVFYTVISADPQATALTFFIKKRSLIDDGVGKVPEPNLNERLTHVQGRGGSAPAYDAAFVGVRRIGFSLWAKTKNKGRYLRDLQLFLDDFDYDAPSRSALFQTHLHFSNQGPIRYSFEALFKARLVLVEVADPDPAVERYVETETLDPGYTFYDKAFSVDLWP